MTAYYNEFDPGAAAWLRNLISEGHIAPGDVDERSITEVTPDDLRGYTQHHFFAGIGGWSYAARLAGWPDDRPLWTGSPPCQPFSTAGKGLGQDDERHLAPHWLALVAAVRPPVVVGEQVASAIRFGWLDDLLDALEAEGYSTGAAVLPACGVGAAHIRQRLWFVGRLGDGDDTRPQGRLGVSERADKFAAGTPGMVSGLADTNARKQGMVGLRDSEIHRGIPRDARTGPRSGGETSGLADSERRGPQSRNQRQGRAKTTRESGGIRGASPTHPGWSTPDWLFCRDGKWRPVESGAFPLAHGVSARVGRGSDQCSAEYAKATTEARVMRLRGYGNAIVPEVAAQVIRIVMEA